MWSAYCACMWWWCRSTCGNAARPHVAMLHEPVCQRRMLPVVFVCVTMRMLRCGARSDRLRRLLNDSGDGGEGDRGGETIEVVNPLHHLQGRPTPPHSGSVRGCVGSGGEAAGLTHTLSRRSPTHPVSPGGEQGAAGRSGTHPPPPAALETCWGYQAVSSADGGSVGLGPFTVGSCDSGLHGGVREDKGVVAGGGGGLGSPYPPPHLSDALRSTRKGGGSPGASAGAQHTASKHLHNHPLHGPSRVSSYYLYMLVQPPFLQHAYAVVVVLGASLVCAMWVPNGEWMCRCVWAGVLGSEKGLWGSPWHRMMCGVACAVCSLCCLCAAFFG